MAPRVSVVVVAYDMARELPRTLHTLDPRRQNDRSTWAETARVFAERFATRSRDEWAAAAEPVDACLTPVLDFLEAAAHPHNLANGLHRADPFPQPDRTIAFAR